MSTGVLCCSSFHFSFSPSSKSSMSSRNVFKCLSLMLLYISHYFELSLQIGCADLLVRQHYSNLFQYLLFYQLCSYLLQNAINILWSLSRISRDRQTNGGLQGLKTTNFLKHGSKSIIKLLPDELFLNSAGLDEHAAL